MLQVYPDEGLILMLRRIANNKDNGLLWALFTNDVDPDPANERSDFTIAGDWGQRTLDDDDFVLEQVVAHVGTIQGNTIFLTNDTGGNVTVYGFIVVEPTSNTLLMVNRFVDGPITVPNGGEVPMTPVLGNYSDKSVPIVDGGTF